MRHLILAVLNLGLGLGGLGCGSDTASGPSSGSSNPTPTPTPTFAEGQGQAPSETEAYAPGPYGLSKGSVIANYMFEGCRNQADCAAKSLQVIQLADFYNPTGTDKYADGSAYGAGTPKPRALLIDTASVWCPPCNDEAHYVLPGLYAKYKPRGGEFLLQLADGPTPGKPALPNNLYAWTKKYKVEHPGTIDPSSKLNPLFADDAFPQNFIIDTKTMRVVDIFVGNPDPDPTKYGPDAASQAAFGKVKAFWAKYESFLNP